MKVSFKDDRQPLGQRFECDPEHLHSMCKFVGIPDGTRLQVVLSNVVKDHEIGELATEYDRKGNCRYTANLAVSDRLEFSADAIRRINRNLAHELRHIAQHAILTSTFDKPIAEAVLMTANKVFCHEALLAERAVKSMPEVWALSPVEEEPCSGDA